MIKKITAWCYMLNEEVMICPICNKPIICCDIGVNEDGYVYHWECTKNIDDIEMRGNKNGCELDSELHISENSRPNVFKIKPLDGLIEK